VKIENVRTPDGPVIPTVLPTSPQNESGEPAWLTQKELDFFFPGDIGEIGTVAYQRSFLAPWIARPFGVPHSSLGILSQKTYRPAERKVAAASSSEPSTSPVSGDQGSETSGAI
jgi:hypothetical protein